MGLPLDTVSAWFVEGKRMRSVTSESLISEAREILDRAEHQHRDLSDFESGRVDALFDVAGRVAPSKPGAQVGTLSATAWVGG